MLQRPGLLCDLILRGGRTAPAKSRLQADYQRLTRPSAARIPAPSANRLKVSRLSQDWLRQEAATPFAKTFEPIRESQADFQSGSESVGTVGWDRTSDLRIHNPAL